MVFYICNEICCIEVNNVQYWIPADIQTNKKIIIHIDTAIYMNVKPKI